MLSTVYSLRDDSGAGAERRVSSGMARRLVSSFEGGGFADGGADGGELVFGVTRGVVRWKMCGSVRWLAELSWRCLLGGKGRSLPEDVRDIGMGAGSKQIEVTANCHEIHGEEGTLLLEHTERI